MSDQDNLELYLNDVYEKECVFKIESCEVQFIQNGIENLVQRIVNDVLENLRRNKEVPVTVLRNSDIIKVGSFYEGTKNTFPDEFDIIFCYYETTKYAVFDYFPVTDVIKKVCNQNRRTLKYQSTSNSKQKIEFEKYLEKHGPATWLHFIYTNSIGDKKCINVDLVPAGRTYITEIGHRTTVSKVCQIGPFEREILSTGSFLYVEDNYSFTETEAYFMGNILSMKHKKVYRILKRLINGHSTEDVYTDKSMSCYTSYVIKSVMIIHHYRCKRTENILLGPCLLEILDQLHTYEYDTHLPRLVAWRLRGPSVVPDFFSELFLREYLKSLTTKLKSMQNATEEYTYNGDKVKKSLLEQYQEENGKSGMDLDFNICSIV
jgi:hypothetical protein